ncbi:unnamed protein product [marine sediment metagenome]|uniref:Uncharacterized protein n=1 Tax=marine sediment metagenome TaxID=412755 RepID=X1IRB8_9ZZZZ
MNVREYDIYQRGCMFVLITTADIIGDTTILITTNENVAIISNLLCFNIPSCTKVSDQPPSQSTKERIFYNGS